MAVLVLIGGDMAPQRIQTSHQHKHFSALTAKSSLKTLNRMERFHVKSFQRPFTPTRVSLTRVVSRTRFGGRGGLLDFVSR